MVILEYWREVLALVFVVAFLAILGYIHHLRYQVSDLRTQNSAISAALRISEGSVKTLQASIDSQNSAINRLKTDADAREQSHAAELTQAKTNADFYKKKAEDLMKRQPPQNVTRCDAANSLINEEILKNVK
jgi:hypothetical protein